MADTLHCDLAIVGGGLAGSLIALAVKAKRPHCDVRLIESADTLGGNHMWSFFASDVRARDRWIVAPLVVHSWPTYAVAFPRHRRAIKQPYYAIESHRLDAVLRERLPVDAIMTGRRVLATSATNVVFGHGERLQAGGVIDARGPGDLSLLECGWQKFVGREYELGTRHGFGRPLIMDATVEQRDGYRFVYCLPTGDTRMFVEDTYYSENGVLDARSVGKRVDAYAEAHGWPTHQRLREEQGVLPVTMGGDFEAYWRSSGKSVAKAGMRAGLFHPTTGYSLPDAIRTAAAIADASDLGGEALYELTHGLASRAWAARGFYRMLDKMLFRAADGPERYRVLERFYRLSPGLIARFYAGRSTLPDKARVLMGKPPVPITRAIGVLTQ